MKEAICYHGKQDRDCQLICFPYLGGYNNSFNDIASLNQCAEIWSINLPGHGTENSQPLQTIQSIVDLYYDELSSIIKPNCIFFGHSMGAVVAYFLLHKILNSDKYSIKPQALVLSGSNPPNYFKNLQCHNLSDVELIDRLRSYGGIRDVIFKERSLLEFFLPVYRADFMVLESAAYCEVEPLDFPAYLLWGEKDHIVPLAKTLEWTNYFSREISLIPIKNGSHMFVHHQAHIVANHLQTIANLTLAQASEGAKTFESQLC